MSTAVRIPVPSHTTPSEEAALVASAAEAYGRVAHVTIVEAEEADFNVTMRLHAGTRWS